MVRGCTGSVTSASTVLLEPRMVSRACCAAGPTEQLACMAAQDGMGTRLAAGLGAGDGLGVRAGEGLKEAVARPVGDGLLRTAAVPPGAQPATANIATTAASLIPTGNWNARARADVTPGIACTPFTISAPVSGLNERRGYRMEAPLAGLAPGRPSGRAHGPPRLDDH